MKPKVIDLFAGVGGFTLGAYEAGFSTALAVDNDRDLSHSFPINFPCAKFFSADISQTSPESLLAEAEIGRYDTFGIVGGPPCQGFSSIGKRSLEDTRNLLVRDFFRFVSALNPAFFVMENVLGILAEPFANILDDALDSVSPNYDLVGPLKLNAADFGAATSRVRAIVIGYRPDYVDAISESDIERRKTKLLRSVFEAIHDLPSPTRGHEDSHGVFWSKYKRLPIAGDQGEYARRARLAPPRGLSSSWIREASQKGLVSCLRPTVHAEAVIHRFANTPQGRREAISRCPRLAWNKLAPTLRAGTGKDHGSHQAIRPIHPAEARVITVREAARIQGFPDWFQFHPTKWHSFRMIGNSVSPILAATILKLVRVHLDNVRDAATG
ncbi:MAG: DNA cytosine methyltransferase [Candidatus Binatus sp.]|jgi:DNA (cytosine-5)-methyltransferase 1